MEQTIETHTDVLNYLIKKYGYKTYLEIGVGDPRDNFCLIECEDKSGVDPYFDFNDVPEYSDTEVKEIIDTLVRYKCTSDEFFENLKEDVKYDLIFIDGYHSEEQCDKDIQNALNHLSENGSVVVHDTCPYRKESAGERPVYTKGFTWNGDVYKSIYKLRVMNIWHVTVGFDFGITVIKWHKGFVKNDNVQKLDITYEDFDRNRTLFLNMVSEKEFLREI